MAQWNIKNVQSPTSSDDLIKMILEQRGISNRSEFLQPPTPLNLTPQDVSISTKQLSKAVALIKKTAQNGGDICIIGDYDADGICATAILWRVMHRMGIDARPFIPSREKHGYGLNSKILADLAAEKLPNLIITVDNGIVAHEPVKEAKAMGCTIIITDHHQPEEKLPEADAIVHTTQLCGATVSWMLAQALDSELVKDELDLAAIATIADQVPLLGANRQFAVHGLEALRESKRIGLQALFTQMGSKQTEATTQTIGYGIAPRINAMGRIAHGMDALRLLCTKNQDRAAQLASILQETNTDRQALTDDLLLSARQQVQQQSEQRVLVVYSAEFHEGVLGLLAGRLTEEFQKPAVAIKVTESYCKGSARSILGVNIVELLRKARSELLEVGGHPMAAGFGLEPTRLQAFAQLLQSLALQQISLEQLQPTLDIVCPIDASLLSPQTAEALESLQPFGQGNPLPVFLFQHMRVLHTALVGKAGKHLKLQLSANNAPVPSIEAIWWGGADQFDVTIGKHIDVAGTLEIDRWNPKKPRLQIVVSDIRQSI